MLKRAKTRIVAAAAAILLHEWAFGAESVPSCEPLSEISGAALFAENCTFCHGPDGKGGGPLAIAKGLTPPDLTTLAARTDGRFPMAHVSQELSRGGGERGDGDRSMPVWRKLFAHECGDAYARQALIELEKFLRTIQEK